MASTLLLPWVLSAGSWSPTRLSPASRTSVYGFFFFSWLIVVARRATPPTAGIQPQGSR